MIGQSIGRYVVESKLGEGGMGVVYKARDTQLERTVALKLLPPAVVADDDRKRRFVQEARAASALNHPNIVTIHDIGSDAGRDFIVMEYLAGGTLDRRLPPAGLTAKQALQYGVAIADALAAAHQVGVIHRDLKPSNVLVTDDGRVKVLDFGLAKLLEPGDSSEHATTVAATDPGIIMGTAGYMSPEQAEGKRLDARSDIFSFGSVLYEMTTGRPPFGGESRLSALGKVVNEDPVAPRQLNPSIPVDLEKVILRCLRKDPGRRFQTMADLKVALEDLVIESATMAQVSAPRQREWLKWAAGAAALLSIAIVAGYLATRQRPAPRSDTQRPVPLTSLSGMVRHPTLSPDGEYVAFTWNGSNQDNPDIYVQQIGSGTPLRLTTDAANDHSPAWSPDGRAIAFLRRRDDSSVHEVRWVPPLGGPERKIAEIHPDGALYRPLTLTWCPDSSCVVATDTQGDGKPNALFALPRDGGERRQITFPTTPAMLDTDAALSADGRSLVFRRDLTPFTGEMYRLGLTGNLSARGTPIRLTDVTMSSTRPAWMPDGRHIVFAARGGLWRMDAFSAVAPERLPFVGQEGGMPTVVGRGGETRMVFVRSTVDTNIWRLDLASAGGPPAAPPQMAIASTRADHLPMLSPNGRRVAFFSGRSGEFELWTADPDGSNAIQLTTLRSAPGFPRWSPDGETIAFHSDPEGHADVLTIAAGGGKPRIVTEGPMIGGFPSFSRDGQWIYFSGPGPAGTTNGQLRVWKIPAAGGTPTQVTPGQGAVTVERYDGQELYFLEVGERPSALWRMHTSGIETPAKMLDGAINASFDACENGIYYVDRAPTPAAVYPNDRPAVETRLRYYEFGTQRIVTVLGDLGRFAAGVTTSRDCRTILFARVDSATDELFLVDNVP